MKKQSIKDKMDESLGERRGKESSKKQSMADRRHESMGADHHYKQMMKHMKHLHKMAKGK